MDRVRANWETIARDAWGITPEERARLEAAPFRSTPEDWRWFAASIHSQVLEGYAAGEMDFRQMLTVMRACSLGCRRTDRILLTALTVERGLRITPKELNRRRPPHPRWLKSFAGELVRALEEDFPHVAVAPSAYSGGSSLILERALAWLTAVGLCSHPPIRPKTLHGWYLERKQSLGKAGRRGRKRKPPNIPPFST